MNKAKTKRVKVAKQAKIYFIILTVVAVALLIWSATLVRLGQDIPLEAKIAAIVFFIFAVALEATAVEIPSYGFASLSFCVYFALIIKYDFPIAVAIAAVALTVRELLVNRQVLWYRLGDFSTTLINVSLSGIIFSVINSGAEFLSVRNVIAMVIGAVAYYGFDYVLSITIMGLLDDETRKEFEAVRGKVRLINLALAPLGALLIIAYAKSPWFTLLALLPLYALRQSLQFGISEIAIANQNELESSLNGLKKDITTLQESNKDLNTDLDKKVNEQTVLLEMGEAFGTSVDLERTLEIVVSMIKRLAQYQSCVIFLVNDNALVAAKSVTPYRDILEYSSLLKLEESIVSLVIRNKKPILIPDMQSMSEQRIFKDEKSLICIPLIVQNEIIGVIYIGAIRPGTYNEDHLHLMSILGHAASNAIRTAQLYEKTEEDLITQRQLTDQLDTKVQSFEMLLEIGQKLGSSLNLEETEKIIIDGLEEMFNYQSAAVFHLIKEKGGSYLIPTRYRSPYEAIIGNLKVLSTDQSNVLGSISHYRRSLLLDDTSETKLQTVLENENSIMIVPMIVESEVIGALYVGHPSPNYFNEEALGLLEAVAHNAAMAITNAQVYEQTAKKAITDGLTGLYTHRYFTERLSGEIKKSIQEKSRLALVMVDADHFKTLNDTLGHPEGDKCLKTLATILRQYSHKQDVVCRIGGDEFTVLLKGTNKKDAIKRAEGIRQAVQDTFENSPVQVTTSIGVAIFPDDARNMKDLVAAADTALYISKKAGRNKVSIPSQAAN